MSKLILLVDDEPDVLTAVSFRLRKNGYEVEIVDSGLQALEYLKNRRPDLILLDVRMPGIDGLETCRRIRSQEGGMNIPIILFTASVNVVQEKGFQEARANDFIAKPFDSQELLTKIQKLLS